VKLAKFCENVGIEFLSTPFDDAAIEFLDPLMKFYKIASADLNNLPFLRKIAAKGKPVVLATGASTLAEVSIAVDTLSQAGCRDIGLLHCVLNYPTKNTDAHLGMIRSLKRSFPGLIIGYSDHTHPDESMIPLLAAHLLGAVIIEKHFTHDKKLPGNDHYHAMDVNDLKRFQELVDRVHSLIGDLSLKSPLPSENVSRKNARRSLVLQRNLPAGHRLTERDLTYKRPGTGIGPEHWDEVLGQVLSRDCRADEILKWSMLG
jgi:N-acetylneuraminate synthase